MHVSTKQRIREKGGSEFDDGASHHPFTCHCLPFCNSALFSFSRIILLNWNKEKKAYGIIYKSPIIHGTETAICAFGIPRSSKI